MEQTLEDPHYLRHVMALAETHEVVASTAVFSHTGVKLVDSGTRFVSGLYEKLIRHKLVSPIDECFTVSDAVTPGSLALDAENLLAELPVLAGLVPGETEHHHLSRMLGTLPLTPPLTFKLTVAREQRPDIYRHSLQVAWCAAALASRLHMAGHEILDAAAAGLFHDLGLLHIDPRLLENGRPLCEAERQYLYSHPVTAFLILDHIPQWHSVVSRGVLEHHERLDGSGYPQGLEGDKLSELGQLLAVAELGATVLVHSGAHSSQLQLDIVLRMNEGKFNRHHAGAMLAALPPATHACDAPSLGEVLDTLVDLAIAFMRWQAVRKEWLHTPLVSFADRRLERLGHNLADVGIDLERWTTIDADVELDLNALTEMDIAANEGTWQLRSIAQEIRRRWKRLQPGSEAAESAVDEWLENVETIHTT